MLFSHVPKLEARQPGDQPGSVLSGKPSHHSEPSNYKFGTRDLISNSLSGYVTSVTSFP